MPIRVLHVIDHLGYGGAPMVVKNIAEGLDPGRVETFVCPLRANPRAVPIKANMIHLGYGKYNPLVIPAIGRVCREHHIDIIHAHLAKSIISSLIASYLTNAKIVIHEHGGIFMGGTNTVFRLLLKALANRATIIVANSQATRRVVQKTTGLPLDSILVVANFVDFGRFDRRLYDRNKARTALGVGERDIVVGFVGRLVDYKGADLLIGAQRILRKNNLQTHLAVVGDGPWRSHLERLVRRAGLGDKVTFTGLCQNPAEIMCAFDIGVVPSRIEPFCLVAIELMRMGVPLIASPVGGLPEIVEHQRTGLLLDRLTPECIGDAVAQLANEPRRREELARNAEVFSRRFDGRQQLQQLAQLYEEIGPLRPLES